ncbi:MAG: hypothetical protein HY720_22590 [Planctomycetes bacterium]|nr:hypothetical protein [Planctomycetota bacterium]
MDQDSGRGSLSSKEMYRRYFELSQRIEVAAEMIQRFLKAGERRRAYDYVLAAQDPSTDSPVEIAFQAALLSFLPAIVDGDSSLRQESYRVVREVLLGDAHPFRHLAAMAAMSGTSRFYLRSFRSDGQPGVGFTQAPPENDRASRILQVAPGWIDMATSDRAVQERLREWVMGSPDVRVERAAILALAAFREEGDWQLLSEKGRDGGTPERAIVARAAAHYPYSAVRDFLVAQLEMEQSSEVITGPQRAVRSAAYSSLLRLAATDPDAESDLKEWLVRERDSWVQEDVTTALGDARFEPRLARELVALSVFDSNPRASGSMLLWILQSRRSEFYDLLEAGLYRQDLPEDQFRAVVEEFEAARSGAPSRQDKLAALGEKLRAALARTRDPELPDEEWRHARAEVASLLREMAREE